MESSKEPRKNGSLQPRKEGHCSPGRRMPEVQAGGSLEFQVAESLKSSGAGVTEGL